MKVFCLSLLIFLFAVFGLGLADNPKAVSPQGQNQPEEQDICFRWAFGALVKAGKEFEFIAIKRETTLKTGDRIKMFVELRKQCFVYVIYHSARGDLYLLFPYDLKQFATDYQTFKKYYIPQGDAWFELDEQVGLETFYLLASARRLQVLERLIREYPSNESAKKHEIAKQILAEVRRLKWQHRKLKTVAERPLQIIGPVRTLDDAGKVAALDVTSIAVEISAESFYSKSFGIDHQ